MTNKMCDFFHFYAYLGAISAKKFLILHDENEKMPIPTGFSLLGRLPAESLPARGQAGAQGHHRIPD